MADRISSKNISLFDEMAAEPVDLIEITGVIKSPRASVSSSPTMVRETSFCM